MARSPRIKIAGHAACYHAVSRSRGRSYLFDDRIKEIFIEQLKKLKDLYYVQYAAYAILDNHYHLLVNFTDPQDIDPDDALRRWNIYHSDTPYTRNGARKQDRDYVVGELTDISSFMKRLNMHLSLGHRRVSAEPGTVWESRYRSSVIERGAAVLMCAAYIDLNAFRASMTPAPEDYRYSSIYDLKHRNETGLISRHLLDEGLGTQGESQAELYHAYQAYVYRTGTRGKRGRAGGIIVSETMLKTLESYRLGGTPEGILSRRRGELIGGKVIAGHRYARQIYEDHVNPGYQGIRREHHASRWIRTFAGGLLSVCSAVMRGGP